MCVRGSSLQHTNKSLQEDHLDWDLNSSLSMVKLHHNHQNKKRIAQKIILYKIIKLLFCHDPLRVRDRFKRRTVCGSPTYLAQTSKIINQNYIIENDIEIIFQVVNRNPNIVKFK